MSTITTTGAGDWSSTTPNAPWPSGILPVADDAVVINHAVALDVARVPATGTLLSLTGSSTLTASLDNAVFHYDGETSASLNATTITSTGGILISLAVTSDGTHRLTINAATINGGTTSGDIAINITTRATIIINATTSINAGTNGSAYAISFGTGSTITSINTPLIHGDIAPAVLAPWASIPINNDCNITEGDVTGKVFGWSGISPTYTPAATAYITFGGKTWYNDIPAAANVRDNDTVAGVTGTIATRTLSAANDTVAAGYYAATTLSAVDADLAVGNIKSGVTVFGFAGAAAGGGGGSWGF